MKKFICIFGFLGLVGINDLIAGAWRYELQREPCNRVEASYWVCRPTELYIGCSEPAQTVCPGYGEPSVGD